MTAGIIALITAFFGFVAALPKIIAAFSKTPEQKKEDLDHSVDQEEQDTNQKGRPA